MKRSLVICSLVGAFALTMMAASRSRTSAPPRDRRSDAPQLSAQPIACSRAPEAVPLASSSAPSAAPSATPAAPSFEDLPALGNTPEGAFARVKLGIMRKDTTILRDATMAATEAQIEALKGCDLILSAEVLGCDIRGNEAVLHVELPMSASFSDYGSKKTPRDLRAVLNNDRWRIDVSALLEETLLRVNETAAQAMLKQIVSTEGVWRQTDSDGNGVQDYWTRDVSGFYGVTDAGGGTLKYIDIAMARADRFGAADYPVVGRAAPRHGYWLRVMRNDETGAPYQQVLGTSPGAYTNPCKYGFCAYPAEYGVTGVHTYIVNETGVVYERDLGPQCANGWDAWPSIDPTNAGWTASD